MRKLCPDCGKQKPLTEFALHPGKADGRATICKPCKRAYDRALYQTIKALEVKRVMKWKADNRERVNEAQNERRSNAVNESSTKAQRSAGGHIAHSDNGRRLARS